MNTVVVNVQVPAAADAPVVADFVEHALRVAYLHRTHLKALPVEEWLCPGVYVLLAGDGSGKVYVGKAIALRKRLQAHANKPPMPWTRALAIRRDTTHGFNSAEVGYLEGRLSAELGAVPSLSVVKGKNDEDTTLPPHVMLSLDPLLDSMLAAVRLAGVDIAKEADEPESTAGPGKRKHPKKIDGTVGDLLAAGLIRAGVEVHLSQGTVTAKGSVTADGEIVVDGVAYASPSKAAAMALGLQSSNGWTTWHVGSPDGPSLDHYRQQWAGLMADNK